MGVLIMMGSFLLAGCSNNGGGNGPLELSPETTLAIRQDFFEQVVNDEFISFEYVQIKRNFGTFNNYIVVEFHPVLPLGGVVLPVDIGGITFGCVNTVSHIVAWNDGNIHNIIDAFDKDILSVSDVQKIHQIIEGA